MRGLLRRAPAVGVLLLLAGCGGQAAGTKSGPADNAAQAVPPAVAAAVTVVSVPTADSQPYHITPGADGNVWFTELKGNKIGRIAPGGAIQEFRMPAGGSQPHGITLASDGNIWVAESGSSRIARITPLGA